MKKTLPYVIVFVLFVCTTFSQQPVINLKVQDIYLLNSESLQNVSLLFHESIHTVSPTMTYNTLLDVEVPSQSNNYSIYPNPSSGISKIVYSLDVSSCLTIELYDVLSNQVAQLEKGEKQIGLYSTLINTQFLTAGIYYCKIDIGGVIFLKKFVVIK